MALRGAGQPFGNLVECVIPGNRCEPGPTGTLVADAAQRLRQALGMVLALGVACDLGADHATRIGLPRGPTDPSDAVDSGFRPGRLDPLDLEGAGARAVMRANAGQKVERQMMLRRCQKQNIGSERWNNAKS